MGASSLLSPALRHYYRITILGFRDDGDIGDFYAEYYLQPLLMTNNCTPEDLSDAVLSLEFLRAPVVAGYLRMGLIRDRQFLRTSHMNEAQLNAYRDYCVHICDLLRETDLRNPPQWLKWLDRL